MFSQMLVSSAGYLGAMTFGALLLVLIRKAVAARIVLAASALLILILTTIFGFITPVLAGSWSSLSGIPFTFFAGIVLALGLLAVARFASPGVATFVLCLLAVQCVLNALLDLKTVFFLSSPFAPAVPTDAANMAAATGIPAVLWTIIWIAIAFGILMLALRFYVAARDRAFDVKRDLPFKQKVEA
jgi:glucan phosphoethanolaminetransferase (alkaline phosphatase superfamily)